MPLQLEDLEFHSPWLLALMLPALLAVWWSHRKKRPSPSLVFPSVVRFRDMPKSWRQRFRFLVPLLHALAVTLLVVAVARPRIGDTTTEERSEGIAIQLVLDRSSSMTESIKIDGENTTRMAAVKRVFKQFVSGGDGLDGRRGDLVGLTTFARFTEENCPLLSDHEPILAAVDNLQTVAPAIDQYGQPVQDPSKHPNPRKLRQNELNRTAIGAGIRSAVLSMIAAEEDFRRGKEDERYEIQGKVVVLLTDGQHNVPESFDPFEAGQLAQQNGIRLYYILIHDQNEYRENIFTGRREVARRYTRDQLLAEPIRVAGAEERVFLARDGDSLREIYQQIDELERSEIGSIVYRNYDEKFHYFLVPGFAALILAFLFAETLFRRTP